MRSFVILAVFCLAGASLASPHEARQPVLESIEGSGRITRGSDAQPEQFPYQVGLALRKDLFTTAWCGGSLISSTFILTAAHCLEGVASATVHLGSTDRNVPEVKRLVTRNNFFRHPEWDYSAVSNDIALLKIDPVEFSKTINKVEIPAKTAAYDSYVSTSAIATGWGRVTDTDNSVASTLQYAPLQVIDNISCSDAYGPAVTPSKICVSTDGGASTCNGDSGGPLVVKDSNVLIGLTSFGAEEGCEMGHPAVFTRVSSYLDWIEKVTGVSY